MIGDEESVKKATDDFEQHCIAYYAKIGEIKAKQARGEHLCEVELILLSRAEVRNI